MFCVNKDYRMYWDEWVPVIPESWENCLFLVLFSKWWRGVYLWKVSTTLFPMAEYALLKFGNTFRLFFDPIRIIVTESSNFLGSELLGRWGTVHHTRIVLQYRRLSVPGIWEHLSIQPSWCLVFMRVLALFELLVRGHDTRNGSGSSRGCTRDACILRGRFPSLLVLYSFQWH